MKREENIEIINYNFNDEEMIYFAWTGFAMGNEPDELKASADYIADTNNNDGLVKAFIKYFN